MKIVLSHPTGNQFVRALLSALADHDLLSEFHTTVAVDAHNKWLSLLPSSVSQEFLRRTYPIPANKIHTHPLLELARMTLPRIGIKSSIKHETGWASIDAVYRNIDKQVAANLLGIKNINKPDAIYAYEDGAASSFAAAKSAGINCLYDLPIGYWRAAKAILKEERERWPDWAATLTGLHDSEQKLARKDKELSLANTVFVASRFTADTLSYYPGTLPPVKIIPYGFPAVNHDRVYTNYKSVVTSLKLLFVGGLSQRKGIADLFAAVSTFGNRVTLTVVGNKAGDDCAALNESLAKHQWIPSLPHEAILKLMREHDVLVFPSLFEGFGLVITEAMAQGTPVITTERTAGPDVIRHGENGWLIEAGSTERLQQAIEDLLINPAQIEAAGKAAMQTAGKRPWEVYGHELLNAIIDNN